MLDTLPLYWLLRPRKPSALIPQSHVSPLSMQSLQSGGALPQGLQRLRRGRLQTCFNFADSLKILDRAQSSFSLTFIRRPSALQNPSHPCETICHRGSTCNASVRGQKHTHKKPVISRLPEFRPGCLWLPSRTPATVSPYTVNTGCFHELGVLFFRVSL